MKFISIVAIASFVCGSVMAQKTYQPEGGSAELKKKKAGRQQVNPKLPMVS